MTEQQPMDEQKSTFQSRGKEFTQQIEVAGDQLVSTVRELIKDGSTKRIVIRGQDDKELFSVPMNVGVVGGGLVTLAAPMLAAVGAVAALVTQVKIDVVRQGDVVEGEAGDVGTQAPVADPSSSEPSGPESGATESGQA